ncbi:MAG: leucine-rich repeat protein [Prevotella sp.]|nr:leucine-rich repeat protein [Prevotella sp.]
MKKLLLFVMMLFVTTSVSALEVEIDGLWYEVISKLKEAKIIQYKDGNKYYGNIIIPETVNYEGVTYEVTSISNNAFEECSMLKSIKIPNSVTFLGDCAF